MPCYGMIDVRRSLVLGDSVCLYRYLGSVLMGGLNGRISYCIYLQIEPPVRISIYLAFGSLMSPHSTAQCEGGGRCFKPQRCSSCVSFMLIGSGASL